MRAEVIAVGTELLLGDIVNTNAASIGATLAAIGVDCLHHVTVGDNEARIAEAITTAMGRADAVIICGGLGPTQDDVTREAIARATGRALVRDDGLAAGLIERFARYGRPMPPSNLRQADVIEGAEVIPQTFGTAPGLLVEHDGVLVAAIPGVPREMRDMMERAVLPALAARAGGARLVSRILRVTGVSEGGLAEQLAPVWDALGDGITMAFLAGGGEVRVRLTAKADDEAGARAMIATAEERIAGALGPLVVGTDEDTLEVVVGRLLADRGWRLATAESLTAGALAARIVDVPGASAWFCGGIVAYRTEVKRDTLGIDAALLDEHGPVSEPVARAMATAARSKLGADVGVALTGVAGPEPQGREPGTVVVAVDGPLGPVSREVRLPGDRATVRQIAVTTGLNMVRLYLLEALRPAGSSSR